jgi:hypothetical protein
VLGVHLERDGDTLRLYDPATKSWLLTVDERAERDAQRAEQAERANALLAEENERLRKEIEQHKRRNGV